MLRRACLPDHVRVIGIGQTLGGKFRLVRLLGDGGMGAVYEAVHERLGNRVAIKIVHPDIARRPGIVERFLQEAKVAAQIRSLHVVQVSDVDQTEGGLPYMVMELLEGEPLASVLDREHRLPVATACEYTQQVLEGLEAAHALGVVHRDLKPDNVFVTFVAQKPVLKIIDFGIAKVRREDQRSLTVAGISMGTAEYMPPEQAFSADRADARSDLYSVGVLLYEMLSGRRPVSGDDARTVAAKVERGEVTLLLHVAPDVPQRLAGLCHRAMAPRQELRFASATEMRVALAGVVAPNTPSGPNPGTPSPDLRLQNVPATATTVRAGGPLPGAEFAQPLASRTPFESAPRSPGMNAAFVPLAQTPPARRAPRRAGGAMWWLVALPVLLGAAAVVVLVATRDDGGGADVAPPGTIGVPGSVGRDVASGAVPSSEPLPSLRPTANVPPVAVQAGDAATVVARADAAPSPPATNPFPPLPSNLQFPFPLPSGSVFQFPSSFPPLFPPPPAPAPGP